MSESQYKERRRELTDARMQVLREFSTGGIKSAEARAKIRGINEELQKLRREAKKNGIKLEEAAG